MKRIAINKAWVVRHLSDYGMLVVLVMLCVFFSIATLDDLTPRGASGGKRLAKEIVKQHGEDVSVFAVARETNEDDEFIAALKERVNVVGSSQGQPSEAKAAVRETPGVIVVALADGNVTRWTPVFEEFEVQLMGPKSYKGSNFLKRDNLANIPGQVAIIAVIAIGMTFVIITAGIDLSVGSLIALSAVVAAWFVREFGGVEASGFGVAAAWAIAILICAAIGLSTGGFVTYFNIPPFIVTLGFMLMARGVAQLITNSQTINEVPSGYTALGRDTTLGIPNAAILMVVLYIVAHLVLAKTKFGRYIYAIGGNREAARLSGVPIQAMLLFVYALCGALAGLGGVMMSSQLAGGSHEWGKFVELYVIAAVVVGGA
ncbi:MAG: ABC transporter permease, partial [Verrucomicrobiota bacterium]